MTQSNRRRQESQRLLIRDASDWTEKELLSMLRMMMLEASIRYMIPLYEWEAFSENLLRGWPVDEPTDPQPLPDGTSAVWKLNEQGVAYAVLTGRLDESYVPHTMPEAVGLWDHNTAAYHLFMSRLKKDIAKEG